MKPRAILAIGAATALLAGAAPGAQASHTNYRGGCHLLASNHTAPNRWDGVVWLDVVATDNSANKVPTGGAVTASCELRINGVPAGTVLGPRFGTGQAIDAGQLPPFTSWDTDVVTLCDHVTVGAESISQCEDVTTASVLLPLVTDLADQAVCLVFSDAICQLAVDTLTGPEIRYDLPSPFRS